MSMTVKSKHLACDSNVAVNSYMGGERFPTVDLYGEAFRQRVGKNNE
jgi:hypothetical protein